MLFRSTHQDSTAKAHIIGYACYRRKSFAIKLLTNLNSFTKSVTTLIHQDNKNYHVNPSRVKTIQKVTTVNPTFKTIHERCENKRVKTMCNTEICYFMYKLSPSSVVKYEYMQLQSKWERHY